MTTRRKSTKLQLRRSISEQLRDSTSKAWDLLWKNVRERRLAASCPSCVAESKTAHQHTKHARQLCFAYQPRLWS
ncbi:stAR-related lipid transfer protein 13 isoform X2 [Tachysurus ichikawai]